MHRRNRVLWGSAAAVASLAFAGTAGADPSSFSGSVANGGCDSARSVTVSGPSRIDAQVSSTTASPTSQSVQILRPDGSVAANDSYDTPGGGTYGVRVCKAYEALDPPTIQYTVRYATGPAGQPALPQAQPQPQPQGGVLGTTARLHNSARGSGAVMTRAGLAWFTVKVGSTGYVKVFDPVHKTHLLYSNASVRYGASTVRISTSRMTLTIDKSGTTDRVSFRSPHFKTSGKVVRGGFTVA